MVARSDIRRNAFHITTGWCIITVRGKLTEVAPIDIHAGIFVVETVQRISVKNVIIGRCHAVDRFAGGGRLAAIFAEYGQGELIVASIARLEGERTGGTSELEAVGSCYLPGVEVSVGGCVADIHGFEVEVGVFAG